MSDRSKLRIRLFFLVSFVSGASLLLVASFVNREVRLAEIGELIVFSPGAVAFSTLVVFAGAAGFTWYVVSIFDRHIVSLVGVVREYSGGDFSHREDKFSDAEYGNVLREVENIVQDLIQRNESSKKKEQLAGAILSSMAEGSLVVDERGHVQMVNVAMREMLGMSELPIDRHYIELIRNPDVSKQIGQALGGRLPSRKEITLNMDRPKSFLSISTPFVVQDKPGVAVVLHDITELRRVEQIREDFVANVSHELRTPLTAIRGSVDALVEENISPAQQRFLDIIARNTLRMERLVSDLLRLARLDAGQERLQLVPCSTKSLFKSLASELTTNLQERHQQLQWNIDKGADVVVADPVKLHDIFRNLIENATHYSPDNSTISLRAAVKRSVDEIVLSVSDRGNGIPEPDLLRIFERFYRVEQLRSDNFRGTGLGLAIVKHLVGLHGGEVSAMNRPDGGAIFEVTFSGRNGNLKDGAIVGNS